MKKQVEVTQGAAICGLIAFFGIIAIAIACIVLFFGFIYGLMAGSAPVTGADIVVGLVVWKMCDIFFA